MSVCTLVILVAVAFLALGAAACCARRHEHTARFTEKLEIREDERLTQDDLP